MQEITLKRAVKFFEDNIIMIASLESKEEKGCAEKCLEVLKRQIPKKDSSETQEKDSSATTNNYVYKNVS